MQKFHSDSNHAKINHVFALEIHNSYVWLKLCIKNSEGPSFCHCTNWKKSRKPFLYDFSINSKFLSLEKCLWYQYVKTYQKDLFITERYIIWLTFEQILKSLDIKTEPAQSFSVEYCSGVLSAFVLRKNSSITSTFNLTWKCYK